MTLFFLVDTSGSMTGRWIHAVSEAMDNCVFRLKKACDDINDIEIEVAILRFATDCSWITSETNPIRLDELYLEPFHTGGVTSTGWAINELNEKLSRSGFLSPSVPRYLPVITLITDGIPSDDWESALARIYKNEWFKKSAKIAFNIGSKCDNSSILYQFTRNRNSIIDVDEPDQLGEILPEVILETVERVVDCRARPYPEDTIDMEKPNPQDFEDLLDWGDEDW